MHGVVFVLRKRSSSKRNGGSLSFLINLRPETIFYIAGLKSFPESLQNINSTDLLLFLPGDALFERLRLSRPVSRDGEPLAERRRLSRPSRPSRPSRGISRVAFSSRSFSRSARSTSRGRCESFLPKSHSRTGRSVAGPYSYNQRVKKV